MDWLNLLNLLERRHMLRLLWALRDGPLRYTVLADRANVPLATFSERLQTLRQADLIVKLAGNREILYDLSPLGRQVVDGLRLMETRINADH